ncbi:MAG: hypothetical protein KF866_06790 [Phycisphaeraceae bacterium]|nr:hypothetical protein [Phycisphaeraceae bacterium]MCW5755440.1 hypothetical protein [Phycisphaeraceae bacterium]
MMVRRGLSIIETAIATVLVGTLVVGAVRIVGTHAASRTVMVQRLQAEFLAQHLAAEIASKFYADPTDSTDVFGPSASEVVSGRTSFNDVDDYHGLSESPPRGPNGAVLTGLTGVTRSVSVAYVTAEGDVSAVDTGLKRVTVSVVRRGRPQASVEFVRSRAADAGRPVPSQTVVVQTVDGGLVGSLLGGAGELVDGTVDLLGGVVGGLLGR